MIRVTSSKVIKRLEERKVKGELIVYICTLLISIILISIAFIPGGAEFFETVLLSIGCSGIAASIMAMFLEYVNLKREQTKKNYYRYVYFNDLSQQLKKLFERVLWFDKAIGSVDLTKDINYFLSLDFVCEAGVMNIDETISFDEAEKRIKDIIVKYKKESWSDSSIIWEDTTVMFRIIGRASEGLYDEIERLKNNRLVLVLYDIVNDDEVQDILNCIEEFPRALLTDKLNNSTALSFMWNGYKNVRKICDFNDEFYVSWQPKCDIKKLYFDSKLEETDVESINKCE